MVQWQLRRFCISHLMMWSARQQAAGSRQLAYAVGNAPLETDGHVARAKSEERRGGDGRSIREQHVVT